jgi:hypothetical protein
MIGIAQGEHDDRERLGAARVTEYAVELHVRLEPGVTGTVENRLLVVESGRDLAGYNIDGEVGLVTVWHRTHTRLTHELCDGDLPPVDVFEYRAQQLVSRYPTDLLSRRITSAVSDSGKGDDEQ